MTDQISFLPMLDDAEHSTWLLSGKPGMQNKNGVYVENVMEFSEGKLNTRIVSRNRKNYAEYYLEAN